MVIMIIFEPVAKIDAVNKQKRVQKTVQYRNINVYKLKEKRELLILTS